MLDSLWTRILTALEGRIPETAIESWLRPCRVTAMDGDVIRIGAPNKYSRDWLVQHYTETIQSAARTVLGGNPVVTIEIDREPERAPAPARALPAVPPSNGLSPRYTFESFVIGNSNQFAQAASQAVAELPSKAYNPLFIYGGVGLGKTHLLHAVGHEIARLYPSLRLLYLSTERFTNDLINAIRYDRTAEFRAKYRTIDLLLIDDIQFISGKERTQE
jgi:chromosomal replication initiator protein